MNKIYLVVVLYFLKLHSWRYKVRILGFPSLGAVCEIDGCGILKWSLNVVDLEIINLDSSRSKLIDLVWYGLSGAHSPSERGSHSRGVTGQLLQRVA